MIDNKRPRDFEKMFVFILVFMLLPCTFEVWAQGNYPDRPIEIIVPQGPGSGVDLSVRLFTDKWAEFLGKPVVVINKPGAGGYIGGKFVAQAKPDGYTLLASSESPLILEPLLRKNPDYNFDSFDLLFIYSKGYQFCHVRGDSPWKKLNEFIEEARNKPGKLKYGTYGVGTSPHFATEVLSKVAGVKLTMVPFKSTPESLNALMAGYVDMCVGGPALVGPEQVRQLAVGDYERPLHSPDLPTLRELGYDIGYNTSIFIGLLAPKGIPDNIRFKLVDAHDKVKRKYGKELEHKIFNAQMVFIDINTKEGIKLFKEKEKLFKEFIPSIGLKTE